MIYDNQILTEAEAKEVSDTVLSLSDSFTKRGFFNTLGASVYLDDLMEYAGLADKTNPVLEANFGQLYKSLMNQMSELMGLPVEFHPYGALPGFHIFGKDSAGKQGHTHEDKPYRRIYWSEPFESPFSFTIAINIPGKAGLDVWLDNDTDQPQYVDYKPGHMYSHFGHILHRIAGVGEPTDENPRITLQGHGAILSLSNKVVIYF
tara:strand:+ start:1525 stop:2139 length:615 start_codon:yes stop_codon:yes gene_type:complete